MNLKNLLLSNRNRFMQEYWPYYNLWMACLIDELAEKSPSKKVIEDICNLIGLEMSQVMNCFHFNNNRKFKRTVN